MLVKKGPPNAGKPELQWPRVAIFGSKLDDIANVLDFFKIPFEMNPNTTRDYDLLIAYPNYANASRKSPLLCIPSHTEDFFSFLRELNVKGKHTKKRLRVDLRIRKKAAISFEISRLFCYSGPIDVLVSFKGCPLLCRVANSKVNLMCVDVFDEIKRILARGMDLKPIHSFRVFSRLDLASIAPRKLGDVLLKSFVQVDVSPEDYASNISSLDGLRYFLLAAAVISANKSFRTLNFWKDGKKFAFTITHDVDTAYGFKVGIGQMRDVERKYGVRSDWNIPTGHYTLNPETLKMLASEGCEIGSHGFRHDGRLIFYNESEINNVCHASKVMLEKLGNCRVRGFRSPLLQHSRSIMRAIKKTGFLYDSSLPAWEVHCRTSGAPHGIGTVYPLMEEGLVELPVTMPQDHQLLVVAGLDPDAVLNFWRSLINYIKSIGGFCNLIVHPDKGLFGNKSLLSYYDDIIREVSRDRECWLALPSQIAEHWIFRSNLNVGAIGKPSTSEVTVTDWCWLNKTFGFTTYRPEDFTFE